MKQLILALLLLLPVAVVAGEGILANDPYVEYSCAARPFEEFNSELPDKPGFELQTVSALEASGGEGGSKGSKMEVPAGQGVWLLAGCGVAYALFLRKRERERKPLPEKLS